MFVRNHRSGNRASIRIAGKPLPQFLLLPENVPSHERSAFSALIARVTNWLRSGTRLPVDDAPDLQATDGASKRDDFLEQIQTLTSTTADDVPNAATEDDVPRHIHLDRSFTQTERIAPLTRRRLRRHTSITWLALVDPDRPLLDAGERLGILRSLAASVSNGAKSQAGEALARAYLEEEGDARILALHALISGRFPEGPSIFREALRTGSDIERSLAVDGLAAQGRIDDVLPALEDRIEAIAAKAALAYVGSSSRSVMRETLKAHLSEARIETLISLLAGLRE